MTPLPKPTPALRRMRRDNPIPMTATQYMRWQARKNRRPAVVTLPTPAEAAAAVTKLQGYPYWRDTIEAAGDGAPHDEVDAAYLAAVRLEPRVVGTEPGRVPMEVARRLYDAGLVRRVA